MQDLVGPISRVQAVAATGESRLGGEDTVVATVSFAQGAVAALRISYAHVAPGSRLDWPMGWSQGIEINGTEGAARVVVSPVGKVDCFDRGGRKLAVRASVGGGMKWALQSRDRFARPGTVYPE